MTIDELKKVVAIGEGERLEFKETTGQRGEAGRTLCAFLNGNGGSVVFGVRRKGVVTGQLVSDKTRRELFEVFDRIEPCVEVETEWIPIDAAHTAIVCRVTGGKDRPYQYEGRAYRRVQSSTTGMPREEYERLLIDRGGFRSDWESQENKSLTLAEMDLDEVRKTAELAREVGRLDLDIDVNDAVRLLKKFKLMRGNVLLNGAAVLFGNDDLVGYPQCEIRLARFKGTGKNEFGDEKRIQGNVFRLLNEAVQFCFKHLNLACRVEGFSRNESLELPPEALREVIINALVHRQYSKAGSVSLAIYDDRLVVTSPGGLPPGKSVADLMSEHDSEPRNQQIARILYLRKSIEAWGRGIERVVKTCEDAGVLPPQFEVYQDTVRVTFARSCANGVEVAEKTPEVAGENVEVAEKTPEVAEKSGAEKCAKQDAGSLLVNVFSDLRSDARHRAEAILCQITADPSVTAKRIALATGVSIRTVSNVLTLLKNVGVLYRIGGDKGGRWMISRGAVGQTGEKVK